MIATFYSYKGGVGRTQLVANLAAYLCFYKAKKVLLIDWDFEAPGLHYYFGKKYQDIQTDGLIELLWEYIDKKENNTITKDNLPTFKKDIHILRLKSSTKNEGVIDFIPAGNYSKDYNKKVNDFDWNRFYNQLEGKMFIEYLKKQIKDLGYDFVFLDSRTGISDYSGICNIQMPDVNVLVAYPNNQNFDGLLKIAENIKNSPYITNGFRKSIILPILSKVETSQNSDSVYWQKQFIIRFGNYIKNSTNINVNEFINNTLLEYIKDMTFEERVLFSEQISENVNLKSMEKTYMEIAKILIEIKILV